MRRWLAADALKPWQHRSWISIRDPDFAVKAARVLDLYAGIWDGQPLGPDDFVICADEKTSIQARCRCHPTLAPGQARAMRVEHDYRRGGALAYLAAWDVHRGQVIGRCEDTTGIEPFARLVTQVMTARALRLRGPGVLDRGQRLLAPRPGLDRPDAATPGRTRTWSTYPCTPPGWTRPRSTSPSSNARSSAPNDFTDLDQIRDRLAAFEARYNAVARPFNWKFTRRDLDEPPPPRRRPRQPSPYPPASGLTTPEGLTG